MNEKEEEVSVDTKVEYIIEAVRMMKRQNEEYPGFLEVLRDHVLNAIGELVRFYMHVSKQVAYIKTMETSYREWLAMRSLTQDPLELRVPPQTTGGPVAGFEDAGTDNQEEPK